MSRLPKLNDERQLAQAQADMHRCLMLATTVHSAIVSDEQQKAKHRRQLLCETLAWLYPAVVGAVSKHDYLEPVMLHLGLQH